MELISTGTATMNIDHTEGEDLLVFSQALLSLVQKARQSRQQADYQHENQLSEYKRRKQALYFNSLSPSEYELSIKHLVDELKI